MIIVDLCVPQTLATAVCRADGVSPAPTGKLIGRSEPLLQDSAKRIRHKSRAGREGRRFGAARGGNATASDEIGAAFSR